MKRNVELMIALMLLVTLPFVVKAGAPDMTTTNLALIKDIYGNPFDRTGSYNLGPTGLRGWIYHWGDGKRAWSPGIDGSMTDVKPYQVLVVAIGTNTPASSVLQIDDVLLGVNTGSNNIPVPLFTNDTRRAIGTAIGEAEAGDGWMNFKIFRGGAKKDVSIRLNIRGKAYSATAPYDCPKSSLILSNAVALLGTINLMGVDYSRCQSLDALALLASGNTNYLPKIQTFARSIRTGPVEGGTWGYAYNGIFLSEYYLKTGDTNVLPVLSGLMKLCALTDRYGTICHGPGAMPKEMLGKPLEDAYLDALMNNGVGGEPGGVSGGYGPVNQVALTANLAMVMGKKCLLHAGWSMHPAVEAAITRGKNFFGWHVQKGEIQYGEHNPWGSASHGDNGKHGQAAVLSSMLGDQPAAVEYWTRLTLAGYLAREYGHTGQGFSYLWTGLGANMGGAKAMAAYVSKIRWHLDLSRRSDGSFAYDGAEQFGPSRAADYWTSTSYYGFGPLAAYILTYATPLKQVYLTGRDLPASNVLSADKVANAIGSAMALTNVFLMTTNQLVDALDEFDPDVRLWAAKELGRRPGVDMASITNLLGSTNPWLRASACQVLGTLKDTNSLPALGQCLSDPDVSVRAHAGLALKRFNHLASPLIPTMLQAYVANAHDPYGIDWEDPWECANGILAEVLFGGWIMTMTQGHDGLVPYTAKADRNLLIPMMRLALKHPDSLPRGSAAGFASQHFTFDDIKAVIPDLMECATTSVLADPMWRGGGRGGSIRALGKFPNPEAVSFALAMQSPWWWAAGTLDCGEDFSSREALEVLATYGDSVRYLLPTLNNYLVEWGQRDGRYTTLVNAIKTISAATTSPVLSNFFPVARSQVVATTNVVAITLTGYSCRTNAVTFNNISKPAHGRLSGKAPKLSYTPDEGYSGVDSFTFRVADQATNSALGTVSIIVGTAGTGIQGQYYDTLDFTSQKVTRVDSQINFDWGTGAPTNTMGSDTFSVRWSGQLLVPETGTYTFSILSSDGARLYVNGQRLIDDWTDHDKAWKDSVPVKLTAGQQAHVWLEYYQNTGNATAKLKWSGPSFAGPNGVIIGTEWLGAKLRGAPAVGLWRRFSEWRKTSSAQQANVGAVVTNTHVYAFSQNVTATQYTNQLIVLSGTHTNFMFPTVPKHGRLSGTAPRVTYTPEANYTGTDSFTFRVTEGVTTSAVATVSITVLYGNPVSYAWTSPGGVWSAAGNWVNAPKTAAAPVAAGSPNYTLNFHRAGTCSVTNDLSTDFLLNKLSLKSALTVNGNSICTTNNGPILPEINQESGNAVTFNAPLTLGATTTLGGLAGGQVTLNGLISGPGCLVINSPGNVNLLYATNTYSGGTIVDSGVVWCTGGGTVKVFGSGPVTLNPSTKFQHNMNSLTNSFTLNGTTLAGGNSFSTTLSGPVTLQGISTIDGGRGGSGSLVISGNISGSGGLITKPGGLSLSGTNTYTGSTTVENGNLLYWKAASVAPGALIIIGRSKVSLNYTGDRRISTLTLGGAVQPDGTYGSTASPATFKNDTYFSGKGTVTCGIDQRPSPSATAAKTHPAR